MTWRTHVAIGTNAVWLAGLAGKVDASILILLPAAAVASLLPDIDASSAKIHYAGGGVFGIFKGAFHGKYFHHRGLMHSLFVAAILATIIKSLTYNSVPLLGQIFFAAYISHPIIDGLNTGVGYFYPFITKRFTLLPRSLTFRVGSVPDTLLMFVGLAGLLLFFAAYAHQLVPQP